MAASTAVRDPRRRSTPGNLPVELSSFVGRSREQLEIRRLLAVTHTVTLTGPGGIGKSRLALRVAHTLGRHFRDGVWWIELAELDSPDRVARALAHALNVYEQPDAAGASTTGSNCWRPKSASSPRATERYGRRSSGVTSCSARRSGSCGDG